MTARFLFIPFFLFITLSLNGQDLRDKRLLTIGGIEISAGEFISSYEKSNSMGEKEDIDQYLQNFILYKQKVADALKLRLDTLSSLEKELKGYRDKLAQDYLIDASVKEVLLKEAYKRLLTEVNVWHILVICPSTASPADTIIAHKKAIDIRERIMRGEGFDQVARSSSDDPSVKSNGGNLGYFTAFQTTMPFEDAAYTLPIGELSYPVRSADGYHIIKVVDRRPSQGSILVKHIMKSSTPDYSDEESKEAEAIINDIYLRLQGGASFEELAKSESDHTPSASRGGEIDWFSAGEVVSEFSEAAFGISDIGLYTTPIKTSNGWHIIKLVDKRPPPTLDEARSYLESQILQSSNTYIAKKAFVNELKKEYNYTIDPVSAKWFIDNSDTLITRGLAQYDIGKVPQGYLYSFADQKVSNREFSLFVRDRGPLKVTDDPRLFFDVMIEENINERIIRYEDSRLEDKYPEFNQLINDFKEDILVFEITDLRMWNKAAGDTRGLLEYYEEHKNSYMSPNSIEAKVYKYLILNGEKALSKAHRKFSKKDDGDRLMQEKLNSRHDTLLIIEEGIWQEGDDPEMDKIDWRRGTEKTTINGYPAIVQILHVNPAAPLPFDSVRNEILVSYTESVGLRWIEQLNSDYPVKVDNLLLEEIRREIR